MTQERLREEGPLPFNPSIAKADAATSDLFSPLKRSNGEIPLFQNPAMSDVYLFKNYLFCQSCIGLIADIPQQVERANRLCEETRSDESYCWPNNQVKAVTIGPGSCPGSVRRSIEHEDQDN